PSVAAAKEVEPAAAPAAAVAAETEGSEISGKIVSVNGPRFVLETRSGLRNVDASNAQETEQAVQIYIGRTVMVRGVSDGSGRLQASTIYSIQGTPDTWEPDRE